MKTKKIKLAELSKKNLSKRQMKSFKGGSDWCNEKCMTQKPLFDEANDFWSKYFFGPLI